jgi:hypothetical protein
VSPHKLHNGPERLLIRLLVKVDERGDVFPPSGRGDVRQILVGLTLGDLLTSKAIAAQMRQANCSPWNTLTCGTVQSKGSLCNYPGCQTLGFWKLGSCLRSRSLLLTPQVSEAELKSPPQKEPSAKYDGQRA